MVSVVNRSAIGSEVIYYTVIRLSNRRTQHGLTDKRHLLRVSGSLPTLRPGRHWPHCLTISIANREFRLTTPNRSLYQRSDARHGPATSRSRYYAGSERHDRREAVELRQIDSHRA